MVLIKRLWELSMSLTQESVELSRIVLYLDAVSRYLITRFLQNLLSDTTEYIRFQEMVPLPRASNDR